ncbi:MAG: nitrate reductase associated protein [Cyanobacteria bacterium J06636_28]
MLPTRGAQPRQQFPWQVKQQAVDHNVDISGDAWRSLTPAQRFALIKLSRPSHENRNFIPAMKEFGLVT